MKTERIGGVLRSIILFSLLHITFCMQGTPVDTLRINEKTNDLDLEIGVQFYHDHDNLFDQSDIYGQALYDSMRHKYSPGNYEEGNLWARFFLKNESVDKEEFILEVDAYSEIHVFYRSIDESEFQEKITGQYVPFPLDDMKHTIFRMNKVKIILDPNVPYEIIVYYPDIKEKIKSSLAIFAFDNWLINRLKRGEKAKIFLGLFFGISLFLALVNFIYYFLYRQRAYVYYSIYIIAITYFLASIHGIFDPSRLAEFPLLYYFIESIALTLIIICYFLFLKSFINTRVRYPLWHKIIITLIIAHIIGFFISFWLFGISKLPITSLEFRSYFIILTLLIGIIFLIKLSIKGERLDIIFLIGSATLFASGIISLSLELLNPNNNNPDLVFQIGIVAELIIFSVGLRMKSRFIEKEKQETQAQLITQLQENERLQLSINHELEVQVDARTKEIQSQNEELIQQQEELVAHRDTLEKQNKVIDQNMKELQQIKSQLEDTVESRTLQLKNANLELVQQNSQLEQYAYITAHNLRAPVARLKGLAYILEKTGGNSDIDDDIVIRIVNSASEMDDVLTDMNTILDIKNKTTSATQHVDLTQVVEKVKKQLEDSLYKSKADVVPNLLVSNIHANEPYLESIFYNLISNALKYRAKNRIPKIVVSSFKDESNIRLEVSDNGIGIDLKKFGSQIFGLYKRFHDHVGGKGLGLYMVKTQVEAMKGSISIESKEGKGTTFTIELPG